jgi:glutamyl-tRNA synthetase
MKLIMDQLGVERYDDPRMATIKAFRRRGFTPEAIRKVIVDCGLSLKEVKITLEMFAAANKAVLGDASSYPFFEEAVPLEIYNLAPGEAECYGEKINFKTGVGKIFIDKKELAKYKSKKDALVRLKKAFNAKITSASDYEGKAMFVSYAKTDYPVVSWVDALIDVEVLMSDGTKKRGFSAPSLLNAKGIVHFEGLGYANIEAKEKGTIECVFSYA